MSAQGVFTRMKRVTFVKGEITSGTPTTGFVACGDGTAFPMLAPLDTIAELEFRVKDAKFVSGHAGVRVNDPSAPPGPDFIADIFAPTTTTYKRASYDGNLTRGYTTTVGDGFVVVDPFNDPYLEVEYDAGSGVMFRDVGDNERAMWLRMILPDWNWLYTGFVNAFSFKQEGANPDYLTNPEYVFLLSYYLTDIFGGPVTTELATASVVFSGEIAYVLADPADNITSPNTQFYIGVEFKMNTAFPYGLEVGIFEMSTNQTSLSGTPTKIPTEYPSTGFVQYTIRLESGDISCPIYMTDASVGVPWGFKAGESFIHEATEWWPYAQNTDPPAVWDANTGEKLPDEVVFAAFDREDQQDQVFNLI